MAYVFQKGEDHTHWVSVPGSLVLLGTEQQRENWVVSENVCDGLGGGEEDADGHGWVEAVHLGEIHEVGWERGARHK